ncbi:MAG: hypothetical protein MR629_02075 [Helicobacter sp.]|uniref:hypothetical protein n=1 Tax=Helicobacter sp. 10-6591 TaxID=2004998 RepID=UPI000DCD5EAD|nr:hypothetical protein [Helicobacter sp. 10-6591]MCI6217313.1 hypothetical protein [Helicobacter sp.]MCI7485574.1 hypothetical protein [Helicobacter sp.]MDD7567430.1 hypothetical protein [Helicobacter sp.]MDY5740347.1 hypothetical protein [Helicobacter sp.]RAX55568.1 hypothetical protein CCY97_03940 [Helicobacter sp. 10-6591]
MKPDNYMSFSIVGGFFIGLAFSILKFERPEFMVIWTIITTIGVHMIVIVCIALYFWFLDSQKPHIKKDKLEKNLEYYRLEFDKKEKETAKISAFLKNIESEQEQEITNAS